MASVDWKKCTTAAGGAMIRHSDRHEDREGVEYSNRDINAEMIDKNSVITITDDDKIRMSGWDDRERGSDVYERLKERIAEIDAAQPPKRIREDRKTIVGFTLTPPENMPPEQYNRFFMHAYSAIAYMCGGKENVSPGYLHVDEMHQYRDPETGKTKTSLPHLHVYGIPYTQEHGINCKHFSTRANMTKLNKMIDNRTRQMFGIGFMTGKGGKHKTVEQLKAENALDDVTAKLSEARTILESYEYHKERAKERVPTLKKTFGGTKIEKPIEEVQQDYEALGFYDSNLAVEQRLTREAIEAQHRAEKRADEAVEHAESVSWDKDSQIYQLQAELHNANVKIERLEQKLLEHGIEPEEHTRQHHRIR